MPTVSTIDFPSPPIDRFPEATIKRPWLKASYDPQAERRQRTDAREPSKAA